MIELDLLPTSDVVRLLLDAEARVVPAARAAIDTIAAAADLIAQRLTAGGRLVLLGAGTSGRLAVAQAAELPGTFGLPRDIVAGVCAGGAAALAGVSTDGDEDDTDAAVADVAATGLDAGGVLVAVAASGSTPYTLTAARWARERRAAVISVTTVVGSPLAALADIAVAAVVGPEVLRGSTRLGAGSAQKALLDTLTTAAMTRYGRVHGDVMIDVVPANAKLRARAAGLVADLTGHTVAEADEALRRTGDNTRAAVLVLLAGLAPAQAAQTAGAYRTLREAITAAGKAAMA